MCLIVPKIRPTFGVSIVCKLRISLCFYMCLCIYVFISLTNSLLIYSKVQVCCNVHTSFICTGSPWYSQSSLTAVPRSRKTIPKFRISLAYSQFLVKFGIWPLITLGPQGLPLHWDWKISVKALPKRLWNLTILAKWLIAIIIISFVNIND